MFFRFLSYNTIIVLGKLISSFVVSKVSAIYLGPSGYALLGNFRNIFQIVLGVSANGFESGTIKHIAENRDDKSYHSKIVSSIISFSFILSLFMGILLLIFACELSEITLKTSNYSYVFRYLAFLLPLISINFIILYIINGLQKIKTYAKLIVLVSLINALLTFFLIYYYRLEGAFIATILVSAVTLILSLLIKDVRDILSKVVLNAKNVSIQIICSMSVYVTMATYSTILISITYFLIRNQIISNYGENTAGYWEAMNKISTFYMVFFTSVFTLYLLPKLSVNKSVVGYRSIMSSYFKRLIPLALIIFLILFLLRTFVVKLFLSEEFEIIEQYFLLQFIGDFIKIIGFSLAFQFHAKKMVTFYFITDAVIYLSFYLLSLYFLDQFDIKGVFYAHILSCILYFLAVSFFIFTKNNKYLEASAE